MSIARIIILTAFLLGFIYLLGVFDDGVDPGDDQYNPPPPPIQKSEPAPRGVALLAAESYITPALRSPSSADYIWESIGASEIDPWGEYRRWEVTGLVDANNAFGATIRTPWRMVLLYEEDSGDWNAGQVFLDGVLIQQPPGYSP